MFGPTTMRGLSREVTEGSRESCFRAPTRGSYYTGTVTEVGVKRRRTGGREGGWEVGDPV